MKVELKTITVRELVESYTDNAEEGVIGYGGKLDIRPPFQREFVYKDDQRDAVLNTIRRGFPLNLMYWAVRDDETYEIIDGQQRTVSVAQYVNGDYSISGLYFHNLPSDHQNQILDYELMVYFCSGTDSEKLEWFKIVNIAGEALTAQELRNAVYAGPWVTSAKQYFSKSLCPAYQLAKDYMRGSPIRQTYLENAIKWISSGRIEEFMGQHQHNNSADELWQYFETVIRWVGSTFVVKRSIMKGIDWGFLYNDYKVRKLDSIKIESECKELIMDDDVTSNSGIYYYVLTRDERYLNIRAFTEQMKLKVFEKQGKKCPSCGKDCELKVMEADHITPWSQGGKTNEDNCQMLCRDCNRKKSDT